MGSKRRRTLDQRVKVSWIKDAFMVGRWSYQVRWERVGWSGAKGKVEERSEPSLQRPETEKERHSIRMNALSTR